MALSFLKMFRKEDAETRTTGAEEAQQGESYEVKLEETQNGGHGHGEGACCGSCS